jgi:hypothetical protein
LPLPLPVLVSMSVLQLVSFLFAAEKLIAGSSYGAARTTLKFTVAPGPP